MAKVASVGPRQSIGIGFKSNIKESLQTFTKEVQEKVVRSGARAAALVFYNDMRQRVPVDTGDLYGSIYHWFDTKQSVQGKQVYAIGPNKAKAPHWHLIEYGHWRVNKIVRLENGQLVATKERLDVPIWVAAQPYIRPAWSLVNQALEAGRQRMRERMAEL